MSFQIFINTDRSLNRLVTEIRTLLSLPPFQQTSLSGAPYCQFETLGMLILIHASDEEDLDPEVRRFPYSFDLQMSFVDHKLDTDSMEYRLQPYYAQLLTFHLDIETAYREQQKSESGWLVRYRFCQKNRKWNSTILFGESGWEPAVIEAPPSSWRSMLPMF